MRQHSSPISPESRCPALALHPLYILQALHNSTLLHRLVVDDAQVSGNKLVLQARSIWDHDFASLVGDDDTGTGETDALAEPHISGNGQVVELGDVRDRLESLLKVLSSTES